MYGSEIACEGFPFGAVINSRYPNLCGGMPFVSISQNAFYAKALEPFSVALFSSTDDNFFVDKRRP